MKTIFQTLEELKKNIPDENLYKKLDFLEDSFKKLRTKSGLKGLVRKKKLRKVLRDIEYEDELQKLQIELIKLQNWAYENKKRIMIILKDAMLPEKAER